MTNTKLDILKQLYSDLTEEERREFKKSLKSRKIPVKVLKTHASIRDFVLTRHTPSCPHCGASRIGKWSSGRLVCKECHRTFSVASGTVFFGAKKDLRTYRRYIGLMMDGTSIRRAAKECGLTVRTSFLWRHKFLDTLAEIMDSVVLGGVVEGDETFFQLSFKGSRRLSRPAHKRGTPARKRGLSKEKVCVPCAVNTEGLSVSRITNLGRVNVASLEGLFAGHIKEKSVFCSDMCQSYVRFAKDFDLQLLQFKSGRKGVFGIQHVNSYHSQLKRFMRPFNGVATKYLNNYLLWHNFVNHGKGTGEMWLDHLAGAKSWDRNRNIQVRPAIPLPDVA